MIPLPSMVICPACLRPVVFTPGTEDYRGPMCSSLSCSAWKVIGKSKNGGPLLSIVQGDDE